MGIYKQRVVYKSASTESAAVPSSDKTIDGVTLIPTSTPILTNAGLSLSITSPVSGQTVSTGQITVKGKTAPKAEVFVNDVELIADATGNFTQVVTLDEGENYILVVANDTDGNFAEKELIITYQIAE